MNKAVELLRKSGIFYLATNNGDQPKVRPFGAVAEINGKLYIATTNNKNCFKQMIANPKVEIAGMINNEDWVRVCGVVKADTTTFTQTEFLKQTPIPGYSVNDGTFELLYFEHGTVEVYLSSGKIESFEL